jgi:hypothetical protein
MEKALEFLKELADKLGQTVESLWPTAVRYVVVQAATNIVFKVATIIFLTVVVRFVWKNLNEFEKGHDSEGRQIGKILSVIVYTVTVFLLIVFMSDDITHIIEPTGTLVARFLSYRP